MKSLYNKNAPFLVISTILTMILLGCYFVFVPYSWINPISIISFVTIMACLVVVSCVRVSDILDDILGAFTGLLIIVIIGGLITLSIRHH